MAKGVKMLDIEAVKRVVKKRRARGATDEDLIQYLERLKAGSWKMFPEDIEELIQEIKQNQ